MANDNENTEARYQACVMKAQETLQEINKEGVDEARANELRAQAQGHFDEAKGLRAQLDLEKQAAEAAEDLEARVEARKAASPKPSDTRRNYEVTQRDTEFTMEDIKRRAEINDRYMRGDTLSDAEKVERHRLFPYEKRFWKMLGSNLPNPLPDFPEAHQVEAEQMRDFPLDAAASPNQNVGTAAQGGNLVPETLRADIIRRMVAYGPLNDGAFVNVISTPGGGDYIFPTNDDTGNVGERINENTTVGFGNTTFGTLTLKAYKYTTKAMAVSRELLQDSIVAVEPLLRDLMSERLGRKLNADFTNGDGNGDPQGVITGVIAQSGQEQHVTTANTIEFKDILKLMHKVDPAYRMNTRFMFHDETLLALMELVDDNDRPLWQPSLQDGAPSRIYGRPYFINQSTPKLTETDKQAVVYGDFTNFAVRRVRDFTIRRADELGMLADQVLFAGFMRADSRVLQPRALSVLTTATS